MLQEFLDQVYFHNRLWDYLIFILFVIAGWIVIRILKKSLLRHLERWTEKIQNSFGERVMTSARKNGLPLLYYGVFYIASQGLQFHESLQRLLELVSVVVFTFFGIRFLVELVVYLLERIWVSGEEEISRRNAFKGIINAIRLICWGLALVLLLDNLGVKISALVTGLGIGGIAVALAAQTVLGDLFNYFTIFFDRPFEIGDFIIIDTYLGTVEHIGLKTTRLRSLSGEQLVISNTDLTSSRVRNYKRMERRRIVFQFRVSYETPLELLKEIPGLVAEIIKTIPGTAFDRAHFFSYGEYSLVFEVVYYVLSGDYNQYMDIQQTINFELREAFDQRGIAFAYPTQTIYVNPKQGGRADGIV